ncbi:hypothetical protein [Paenibacillus roseipurpureus]|uniref:Uncharacterized protein n=1 Tax=Paenibacillus roseopurpureus TaxID=2918901 RepID=A0AA96RH45_9BACL|nr:hypothetical protein [Paenibacillus sp. MBLB1832]WNR42918.1 hypothetical protein MJB10_17570 [Paenibacillus sp. MBLB1832]
MLKIDNNEHYITPSYLTDSLGDFVDAIIRLKPEFVDADEVKGYSCFEWDCEPAIYKWFLYNEPDNKVRIKILVYADEFQASAKETINGICDFDNLVSKIVSGYIQLKEYITKRRNIEVKVFNQDEWNEYYHSSFDEELSLLKKALN